MMRKIFYYISPVILPILFLCFWHYSALNIQNPVVLPDVGRVADILAHPAMDLLSLGTMIFNVFISLLRVSLGYIIAFILGVVLGMAIGYFKNAERFCFLFINMFRPIAPLAWVPLVLAWFGVTSIGTIFNFTDLKVYSFFNNIKLTMIFVIFIGAFFPILTNTIYGVKSVRITLLDSARTLGATQWDIFKEVLLPASLPSVVTGMRVGLGVAWMCLVSAEMLPGSLSGIGYLITHAYTVARTDIVIAGIVTISFIGGMLDFIFQRIERKFFKWQRLSG